MKVISPARDSGVSMLPFSVITTKHGILRAHQSVLEPQLSTAVSCLLSLGIWGSSRAGWPQMCSLTYKTPALIKAKIKRAVGTADPKQQLSPPPPHSTTPLGPGETNHQFTSQQLALVVSLHDLPWLLLALRMRSLREGDSGEELRKSSSKTQSGGRREPLSHGGPCR